MRKGFENPSFTVLAVAVTLMGSAACGSEVENPEPNPPTQTAEPQRTLRPFPAPSRTSPTLETYDEPQIREDVSNVAADIVTTFRCLTGGKKASKNTTTTETTFMWDGGTISARATTVPTLGEITLEIANEEAGRYVAATVVGDIDHDTLFLHGNTIIKRAELIASAKNAAEGGTANDIKAIDGLDSEGNRLDVGLKRNPDKDDTWNLMNNDVAVDVANEAVARNVNRDVSGTLNKILKAGKATRCAT